MAFRARPLPSRRGDRQSKVRQLSGHRRCDRSRDQPHRNAVRGTSGTGRTFDGLVDAVHERFGRPDALVNNAGMSPVYDKQTDVTESCSTRWSANRQGPLPALGTGRRTHGGHKRRGHHQRPVRMGRCGHTVVIPYAASKAGLNAMTEGSRMAFGPTVPQHADARTPSSPTSARRGVSRVRRTCSGTSHYSGPGIPTRSSAPLF